MAGVDLGRVAYVPKGAYDALATYSRLDVVSYQGGSFVSLIDNNTGNTPVAGVNWALVAAKGDKGDKGDKGATGAQGVKGDTGVVGPQGPKGDTGPIGPQGVVGDTGAVGPQGPKGDTGAKGEKGDKGDIGATGATGPQGLKGDKGDKGDTGAVGPIGPKGDPGQNGVISVDAPSDGKTYGRKDEGWAEVVIPDIIPVLSEAPGIYTTTYTDAEGVIQPFKIGQMCRVSVSTFSLRAPSWSPDYDYEFYVMTQGWFDMEGNENTDPYDYAWWTKITWKSATQASSGLMSSEDKKHLDNAVVPTNVTVATTLTSLSIANYSIKVTLSAASALSFASTPEEGWECMIDIKNISSSNITQALPNASGWQCEDASIAIAAGKIASISVRRVHNTYVVIAKGN